MATAAEIHRLVEDVKKSNEMRDGFIARIQAGGNFDLAKAWEEFETFDNEVRERLRTIIRTP